MMSNLSLSKTNHVRDNQLIRSNAFSAKKKFRTDLGSKFDDFCDKYGLDVYFYYFFSSPESTSLQDSTSLEPSGVTVHSRCPTCVQQSEKNNEKSNA